MSNRQGHAHTTVLHEDKLLPHQAEHAVKIASLANAPEYSARSVVYELCGGLFELIAVLAASASSVNSPCRSLAQQMTKVENKLWRTRTDGNTCFGGWYKRPAATRAGRLPEKSFEYTLATEGERHFLHR